MPESIFDQKSRVRAPRVHITYEVETGGAIVLKEIPFVMGVLADLSGQPAAPLAKLKERGFIDIDRDNFDDVLRSMKPRLALRVDNRLKGDARQLTVELDFAKLADFRPENIVKQVRPLARLQEMRSKLKDLLGRLEGNERLEELLTAVADNSTVRQKLSETLGARAAGEAREG